MEIEIGKEQDKPLEAWIPDHSNITKKSLVTKLLVVGKYSTSASSILFILLPEKKVVPLIVLLAFFIYFGVAASFYFD